MKYVGILGGSFNPIHNGHLNIAKRAYEQFHLDEIWFLPAFLQPLKQGMSATVSADDRKRMVELAVRDFPFFSMCSYELEKKGVSYTCETLRALKNTHPDTEFFFILGADSIYTFDSWKDPETICSCASLLVAARHQNGKPDSLLAKRAAYLTETYGARIHFIDAPFYDISSTEIRADHKAGCAAKYLPAAVLRYIETHGLYKNR